MKIFISWSGEESQRAALALRDWVAVVLPYTETWVSSEDIAKGSRWGIKLADQLETTNCGIICLTPSNIAEPWINFEAGALSKVVTGSQVHPLLLGIQAISLTGPLSQFQATQFNKSDVKKLVVTINDSAKINAIPSNQLDRNFEVCWGDLEKKMAPILDTAEKNPSAKIPNNVDKPTEKNLSDEEIKTLQILAEANGESVFPQDLANLLKIHPERAKHIMEKLEGFGLLKVSYNYLDGTSWYLSKMGRAELVQRNIL